MNTLWASKTMGTRLEHQRQAHLGEAFELLKSLHTQDFDGNPRALRTTENRISLLGETNRHLLEVFREHEVLKAALSGKDADLERIEAETRRMVDRLLFHHTGYSTRESLVKAMPFRRMTVAENLEESLEIGTAEGFHRFGMLQTDVDGLGGLKRSIGHDGANDLLVTLMSIFTDPNTPTNMRLKELGITTHTIAAGGDECLVTIAGTIHIQRTMIDDWVDGFEADTAAHEGLRSMIASDPVYRSITTQLGNDFSPTITASGITLADGVLAAQRGIGVIPHLSSAQNFEEATDIIARGMFALGERLLGIRKVEFRRNLQERNPEIAALLYSGKQMSHEKEAAA